MENTTDHQISHGLKAPSEFSKTGSIPFTIVPVGYLSSPEKCLPTGSHAKPNLADAGKVHQVVTEPPFVKMELWSVSPTSIRSPVVPTGWVIKRQFGRRTWVARPMAMDRKQSPNGALDWKILKVGDSKPILPPGSKTTSLTLPLPTGHADRRSPGQLDD